MRKFCVASGLMPLDTFTTMSKSPLALPATTPESSPVFAFRLTPEGRSPETLVKVYPVG